MNEFSLIFVRMEVAQEAPGPFVAGLARPSHSRRGFAGGPPDAPGVDGLLGTDGRGVWWCCKICAWLSYDTGLDHWGDSQEECQAGIILIQGRRLTSSFLHEYRQITIKFK